MNNIFSKVFLLDLRLLIITQERYIGIYKSVFNSEKLKYQFFMTVQHFTVKIKSLIFFSLKISAVFQFIYLIIIRSHCQGYLFFSENPISD
jgi:hypothetical protein